MGGFIVILIFILTGFSLFLSWLNKNSKRSVEMDEIMKRLDKIEDTLEEISNKKKKE